MQSDSMKILDETVDELENRYLQEHLAGGGQAMGYPCPYLPEEILMAAGFLPYRLRATRIRETDLGDVYMSCFTCSFCRHSLHVMLDGQLDFLSGMAAISSCDHMRRVMDHVRLQEIYPFYHMVDLPRTAREASIPYFLSRLEGLRKALEEFTGRPITDEALSEAIRTSNEIRRRLKRLMDLQGRERPALTGAEMLAVNVAAASLPKDVLSDALGRLIDEREGRPDAGGTPPRLRVILGGSALDDPDYVKVIEEQGAAVVGDYLDYGARNFMDLVDEDEPPMEAIARRYILRASCPRMYDALPDRVSRIEGLIESQGAQALILEGIKFCDLWGYDNHFLTKAFEERLPVLVLEKEYLTGGVGQLRTRIQAFIERVEEGGKTRERVAAKPSVAPVSP